jgi:FMN phosphatase YigB (HAD superfamily)
MAVTAVVFDVGDTLVDETRYLEAGGDAPLEPGDFYADALESLVELRARGYSLGLAGNDPSTTEAFLRDRGLDVDVVAGSSAWGVAKGSPAFFERLVEEIGREAGEIAYVGDRLDSDVLPAKHAGLVGVFLRRGPRAYVQALQPKAAEADIRINSLRELLEVLPA